MRPIKRLIATLTLVLASAGTAQAATEAAFATARQAGSEIADWISGLEPKPKSLGVFSVRARAPLDQESADLVETATVQSLMEKREPTITTCPVCKTKRVEVRGDRLTVDPDAAEIKALREQAKASGTEAFLVVDLVPARLAVNVAAQLMETSSGQPLATKTFKVPSLAWSESATQVLFTLGPTFTDEDVGIVGNVLVLQEIGFAKGGLDLGFVNAGARGSLVYLLPTIGWRGDFGASGVHTLKTVGLGYGISNTTAGLVGRLGYEVFIGSFTNIGIEASGLIPMQRREAGKEPLSATLTLHIGFALGL